MGFILIGTVTLAGSLALLWTILKVLIGLGLVIFVHELGHFLVAKACGVKCEKFYIGFDVPLKLGPIALPRTLGKVQWGETEYGIGIIPLGGYVKMLGQDDNPANAQREAERIKIRQQDANRDAPSAQETATSQASANHSASDANFEWDPRSFPAKSVPQRMAIISAGVIMNLIFAVIFAATAYRMGVKSEPCEVGGTTPGSPAWVNNIPVGSKILQIGHEGVKSEHLRFTWDLRQKVAHSGMADEPRPLDLLLREPDGEQQWVKIQPSDRLKQLGISDFVSLGIRSTFCTTLAQQTPVRPYMSAAKAEPSLEPGDRIIGVNDQRFDTSRANRQGDLPADELEAALTAHPDEPLRLLVQRTSDHSESGQQTHTLEVTLPPNPAQVVGIRVGMGPVEAVREDSPAASAGFQPGDIIQQINGQPLSDVMQLPAQLRRLVGQQVVVEVARPAAEAGKEATTVQLTVTPEARDRYTPDVGPGSLIGIESLGVAYSVTNQLIGVVPGSSADIAGLLAGDQIVSARFVAPDDDTAQLAKQLFGPTFADTIEFDAQQRNWPHVFSFLQLLPPSVRLELVLERNGQEVVAKLESQAAEDRYSVERGLRLTPLSRIHTASSWIMATRLGIRETKEKFFQVIDVLVKLVTFQLSPKNLGGPIMIAAVAGSEASQGVPRLLLFLTFLSANLAILNFLPIPALDGGHMLFLTAEAVIGKPVDERLQGTLTMIGVAALLALMIFVFANDIGRFFM